MGNEINLTRLSQEALPVAKKYDIDRSGDLNAEEQEKFLSVWNQQNPGKSPLLMQLHIKSLSEDARIIAEECDIDGLKGILTEGEIKEFMDKYEASGIKYAFKNGADVAEAITGTRKRELEQSGQLENYKNNILNKFDVKFALYRNWLKLDIMNYKGSDKFFHAVGNFEAMLVGSETMVEKICAGQDEDKRSSMQRSETDYTEDLYANWLGREFAKMYPTETAHDLFAPLAPRGFDIEKAKKDIIELAFDTKENNWIQKKCQKYIRFFKESFIKKD